MSCCLENPTNHWKHLPRCKNVLYGMAKCFRWTSVGQCQISRPSVFSLSSCYDFSYVFIHHLLRTCIFTYVHCYYPMLGKFLRISRIIGLTWHTRTQLLAQNQIRFLSYLYMTLRSKFHSLAMGKQHSARQIPSIVSLSLL